MNKLVILTLLALTAIAGVFVYHKMHSGSVKGSVNVVEPEIKEAFIKFKQDFEKDYGSLLGAESYRLSVFADNYKLIQKHNAGKHSYTMAINQFSDLTTEEFKQQYLSLLPTDKLEQENVVELTSEVMVDSVDWRTKGAVTPVKDQGQCGSCWAFSSTGGLEGLAGVMGEKPLPSFSEQQLVDCTWSIFGNHGCNGGIMDNSFKYVKNNGISTETEYPAPYSAKKNFFCKKTGGEFKIKSWVDVPAGNVDQLAAACNKQPVSIAVDAETWQHYSGGVLDNNCGTQLDHGVLLVGYSPDYWIVKNSWNTTWGEKGYIRLKRGNTCGLANRASYPTN